MQNTVKQYKAILAKRNALSHAMGVLELRQRNGNAQKRRAAHGGDYGNIERGKLQIAGE